jgi:hypothetical protein
MSRKLHLGAAVALPFAAAGVLAASAASSSDESPGQIIDVVAKQAQEDTFLDLGETGFSAGDQIVFTNDLFEGGMKVGEDGGTCTVVRMAAEGAFTVHCAGTNSLPGGQIAVQGLITVSPDTEGQPFHLSITGGTGRYRRARGQVVGVDASETEMRLRFELAH